MQVIHIEYSRRRNRKLRKLNSLSHIFHHLVSFGMFCCFLETGFTRFLSAYPAVDSSKSRGMFLNSCYAHCQTGTHETWLRADFPLLDNKTPGEAGVNWFQGTADSVRQFTWIFEVLQYFYFFMMSRTRTLKMY